MNEALSEVIGLLDLERLEDNLFRGESRDIGAPQVFGGQILGQALSAAHCTVEERSPHSLHAYFLRPGDFNQPVVYQVERSRDGGSYSNRRVVAVQHGRPILNLAASFHAAEAGYDHQVEMPDVPGPDGLSKSIDIHDSIIDKVPEKMRRLLAHRPPLEFRPVEAPKFIDPQPRPPRKHVWMRAWEALPDEPELHRNLLTYVSDYELLGTATLPHDLDFSTRPVQMASIDHALWFHRPFRVDEWLLYACDSPTSHGGRGFTRGQFFTQSGELVASTAQEGVIRPWDPAKRRRGG
ncbi:acyl-CoA thioesterase II [Wenzhouxiangella sp. XN201]|uniref:acyl-CoA thioesterase n=1 Tax=Wenzhouxiangella sp. XN201 TaxID=2710755 RepID=UPI0013C570DA|nr:acyl-CoA thioesterase II [Wenzhouxiangella sp. XN201]NEZ03645.1 acyl-CoA thioesterase II [Wenzhouxiangella sp. XN201]